MICGSVVFLGADTNTGVMIEMLDEETVVELMDIMEWTVGMGVEEGVMDTGVLDVDGGGGGGAMIEDVVGTGV